MMPYGFTVFCDDIRQEVNGKTTLVGCYSGDMNFSKPAPARVANLCAYINIRIPNGTRFEAIHVWANHQQGEDVKTIFSAEIEVESLEGVADMPDGAEYVSIIIPCQWTPFEARESGRLSIRARFDDGDELKLDTLNIRFPVE
ncbi:hypothetical protein [Nioella sp. MMSF_3534]|uniref:hypothetical protein n=1 Tax=Nioella sp. MMSF_3534 TaxID=3046720 RepID=UPI00273ED27E|nr:hypothetical protein [Nioella sp. MMSF_3534]